MPRLLGGATVTPVLESVAEPGSGKFVELGAWENAYFATISNFAHLDGQP